MLRRGRRSALGVSLFPFLTVLAVVMGTLTLIISGMTLLALPDTKQVIDPVASSGHQKQPLYIECQEDRLLVHPGARPIPLNPPPEDDGDLWARAEGFVDTLHNNADFTQVISEISRNRDQRYVILLIRPRGIAAYRAARHLVEQEGIDIGYEPVYALGPIEIRDSNGRAIP